MLSILSSLYYPSLVLASTALLVVGVVNALELYHSIYPSFVTSASQRRLTVLYRSVQLAAVAFCETAILLALIGGGTSAH